MSALDRIEACTEQEKHNALAFIAGYRPETLARALDNIEYHRKPPRIPEPTEPLAEVEASTRGRERRRLVRGLTRGGGGSDVRWVDGVSSWSWHELIDPTPVERVTV